MHLGSGGRRLAQVRTDRGLTQEQLAHKVGRSRPCISRWETDPHCEMRSPDVIKLAKVLGCSAPDLQAPIDAPVPSLPSSWTQTGRRIAQAADFLRWRWRKKKSSSTEG